MSETDAVVFGMADEAAEAGVMGTDVVGFRSGRGRVPVVIVVGFRSGSGSAPVTAGTGAAARCGLRSGKVGGGAGRADGDFAFAAAGSGARHATKTSNGKACARMRFISSIGTGYDPASSGQDVPQAGEPRR